MDFAKASPLPKFNGQDFPVWKAQVLAYLTAINKVHVVQNARPRNILSGPEADKLKREQEIEVYNKEDNYVRSILMLALDNKEARSVLSATTSKDLWERLVTVQEQKASTSKVTLQQEFFSIKLRKDELIRDYVARAEYAFNRMVDAGAKGHKEDTLIDTIISGLPPLYITFVQGWSVLDTKLQTLQELIGRLQYTENIINKHKKTESANLADNNNKKRNNKSKGNKKKGNNPKHNNSWKKTGACLACGDKNHKLIECPKYDPNYKEKKLKQQQNQASTSNQDKKATSKKERSESESSLVAEQALFCDSSSKWLVDSGATRHMTFERSDYYSYQELNETITIKFGGSETGTGVGVGSVKIRTSVDGRFKVIKLHDVLHVPELRRKLISLSSASESGAKGIIDADSITIYNNHDHKILVANREKNLYCVETFHVEMSTTDENNIRLWHERCGHINVDYLLKTAKSVQGLEDLQNVKLSNNKSYESIDCVSCCKGKLAKQHLPRRSSEQATEVGERVHMDIGGPLGIATFNGDFYYLLLKDEYSSYRFVYTMKSRNEAFDHIKATVARIKAETKQDVRYLFSDRGSEFTSNRSQEFFVNNKIVHQVTAPFHPAQNGIIERDNRTVMEGVRTMLIARSTPNYLWGEAIQAFVYILNRTTNKKTQNKSAYELYFSTKESIKKPKLNHLRVFGCLAFYKTQTKKRSGYQKKIEDRAIEGILVGYEQNFTYRIFDKEEKKIIVTHDVKFDEAKGSSDKPDIEFLQDHILGYYDEDLIEDEEAANLTNDILEPSTYDEAINSSDADKWREAMTEEYNALVKNNTWTIVDLPEGRKPISSKWVYKIKYKRDQVDKYKARLVARGFTQRYGFDYTETFSPVVKMDTIRLLLTLANQFSWGMVQMDVKTAFLNGTIEEEIYMSQPIGFNNSTKQVCKLNRSIYGLKQASLAWNRCFTRFLKEFNLRALSSDSCVFVNRGCQILERNQPLLIVCIYVDDGLIFSNQQSTIKACIRHLSSKFEITTTKPDTFVGLEIRRDGDQLFMGQSSYIRALIAKFGLNQANPSSLPFRPSIKVNKSGLVGSDSKDVANVPYRQLIGSLLYASCLTRPDICYYVNLMARFSESPKLAHWSLLKEIAKYLIGREQECLVCTKNQNNSLVLNCYSDSDYGRCEDTRRSTTGLVVMLNSTPIIWKSKRQTIAVTSTCEAEFVAASHASKEVLWVRNILKELGATLPPTPLLVDNLGSIKLIENDQAHAKTKHLDVKLHFIRDINKEHIALEHVRTEENVADILTKPLPKPQFDKLKNKLGLRRGEATYAMSFALLSLLVLLTAPSNAFLFGPGSTIQPYEIELHSHCPCDYVLDPSAAANRDQHMADSNTCKLKPTWDHLDCIDRYRHIMTYAKRFPHWASRSKRSVVSDIYDGLTQLPKLIVSAGTIIFKSIAEVVGAEEIIGATSIKLLNNLIDVCNKDSNNGTLVPIDRTMDEITRVSTYANEPRRKTQLRLVAAAQPIISRTSEYIYDELSAAELLFAMIGDALTKGHVDTRALSEMAGYTDLAQVNMDSTRIIAVHYSESDPEPCKGVSIIKFVFDAIIDHDYWSRLILSDLLILVIGIVVSCLVGYQLWSRHWSPRSKQSTQIIELSAPAEFPQGIPSGSMIVENFYGSNESHSRFQTSL